MQHTKAFSLVELSVVLVILGLLVGGIMAGQSMIRSAELRSVISEYNRYASAVGAFAEKYSGLPGDLRNATRLWGEGTCPGTSASPATGMATCNGNHDRNIQSLATGTDVYGNTHGNEIYRSWQHLSNAGLVEGSFTGVPDNTTATALNSAIGQNVPAGRLSRTGWTLFGVQDISVSNLSWFDGNYGNTLIFGLVSGANITMAPALTPEEAWGVDSKLDDGKPALGSVRSMESQGGNCSDLAASNSASRAASTYKMSNTDVACSLIFKTGL